MAETVETSIEQLVPHDHPMILIDRLIEADDESALGEVTIKEETPFLTAGGVPVYVGIEYMAQTVAAHGGWLALREGEPVRVGFLLGTKKMTTHVTHFPLGMRIQVKVHCEWGDEALMNYQCSLSDVVTGKPLASCGLNVFQPKDLDGYLSQNTPEAGS